MLAAVAAAVGIVGATRGAAAEPIALTCSQGGCSPFAAYTCHTTVDNLSVTVDADIPTINGHGYDAVKIAPGCTGSLTVHISTVSEDGLKIVGGHDLTIDGDVGCSDHIPGAHQDGMQALSGSNITMSLAIACTSATNAQWFVNGISTDSSAWPHSVVCDSCTATPAPTNYHSVTIGASYSSGMQHSTICPGSAPNLVYAISPKAVDPLNVDNTFPSSC